MSLFATAVRRASGFTRYALTKMRARIEMQRVRRNPTELVRRLCTARQILVICYGNIIRSAFAGRLLQLWLGPRCHVRVISAGTQATPGQPPHPLALRVAARMRVDLSHHSSSRVSLDDIRSSDLVFSVDLMQLVALRLRFPDAQGKMFLLTCLAPATPLEIADPILGDERAFEVCFSHITRAVDHIRRVITEPVLSR
jgi:protein-tyrosine-phosphatase